MTDKQPEALRLADLLEINDTPLNMTAATELRRLHEVNAELVEALMNIAQSTDDCWQRYLANTALNKAEGK